MLYTFTAPRALQRYLVEKGSVALNGVSLTVFDCSARGFTVSLVPHTLRHTTLGRLRPGARLNLETDMLARYVERLLRRGRR
jgi:riboflavin synthase